MCHLLQIRQVRLKTTIGLSNEEGTGDLDKTDFVEWGGENPDWNRFERNGRKGMREYRQLF